MKKVIIGSTNPVKIDATREAFEKVFPEEEFEFVGCEAVSGVPDQPMGKVETKQGAENRALYCHTNFPEADFYIGLEGGLEKFENEYWASAWMCVMDKIGKKGFGETSSFVLPSKVSQLIDEGKELGHATDEVFAEVNSKQKGGTVAILTNGLITRKDFYREALIFALIPFVNPELYSDN